MSDDPTVQTSAPDPAEALVRPDGRPARPPRRVPQTDRCPRCLAGSDKRVASGGFGTPHPVCGACGYEWHDEVFRG